jgi:hypothetical protein|eukprot:2512633-Prymnesium_polylepis.2
MPVRGKNKLGDWKRSAPPNKAPEGYPTTVAGAWTLEASEGSGNRGKYMESDNYLPVFELMEYG